ncbi:MAG: hypothetical protein P8078_08595 [bacterium]
MGIIKWSNQKIKSYTVWDIGVLKIFCVIAGLILGAYVSSFVKQYLWWLIIISIVLFIFLIIRFLTAKINT